MDDEDDSGGLFAIEVSSEDEATKSAPKIPRDFQSEEDFQRIKDTYKPKIETGEVCFSIFLNCPTLCISPSFHTLHSLPITMFYVISKNHNMASTNPKPQLCFCSYGLS